MRFRFTLLLCGAMLSLVIMAMEKRHNLLYLQTGVNLILLAGALGTLRGRHAAQAICIALVVAVTALMQINDWLDWRIPSLIVLQVVFSTVMYTALSAAVLRIVFADTTMTLESVNGAVTVYVLMALIFGRLYALLEHLAPGSFRFNGPPPPHVDIPPYADMVFYSASTLTTLGLGDITPISSLARSATIAEAFTGQMFMTVLIARLVGIHIANLSTAPKRD
jgi:hypothetical protein